LDTGREKGGGPELLLLLPRKKNKTKENLKDYERSRMGVCATERKERNGGEERPYIGGGWGTTRGQLTRRKWRIYWSIISFIFQKEICGINICRWETKAGGKQEEIISACTAKPLP
jgi:hypothetical protein